jgi:hypothetical protein
MPSTVLGGDFVAAAIVLVRGFAPKLAGAVGVVLVRGFAPKLAGAVGCV